MSSNPSLGKKNITKKKERKEREELHLKQAPRDFPRVTSTHQVIGQSGKNSNWPPYAKAQDQTKKEGGKENTRKGERQKERERGYLHGTDDRHQRDCSQRPTKGEAKKTEEKRQEEESGITSGSGTSWHIWSSPKGLLTTSHEREAKPSPRQYASFDTLCMYSPFLMNALARALFCLLIRSASVFST